MATLSKIRPCLWFDTQGEEAAKFYCSIFPNSKIDVVALYTEEGQEHHRQKPGSAMCVAFTLDGQQMMALNGGPQFKFDEAISLMVQCDTQDEIDHYWSKLSADPKNEVCGWCKDKYGLAWQIVYTGMDEIMRKSDKTQLARVMKIVMASKKFNIAELEGAYRG